MRVRLWLLPCLAALVCCPRSALASCAQPANAIESENCLTGNPSSQWDLNGSSDPTIQGFATDISVNAGQPISFKVQTNAPSFSIQVYRLGYYAGMGARLVLTLPNVTGTLQPACLTDAATGLIDCGNWSISASWTVPSAQVSGIYVAKLVRTDTGGASQIPFIVRNDASTSAVFFQTSDTTWQAYNQYGGNSLYVGAPGVSPSRAYKVSYNRPFTTRDTTPNNFLFNSEYPMVRWLEANGFDVSYTTGVDAERNGSLIANHHVYMPVGHDEYWSGTQRANVQAALDGGVHMAFLTGNGIFWKTRWEPSIDASQAPYRTLVSYKETHANAVIDPSDPPTWTGSWMDPRFSPPADGGLPQNALMGTIFQVNCCTYAISVPQADGMMRFWRNTAVAALGLGATYTTPAGTLGYEWDSDLDNGFRPAGLFHLSTTTVNAPQVLLDYGSTYGPETATHNLTLYKRTNGALVFGAGTTQWSWGLDSNHDGGNAAADAAMQQATVNLLADMGVQPATLQLPLIPAIASADTTGPTSSISFPAPNANVTAGVALTISGTALDAGGGVVGGVEVSVDSGNTWHPAKGRANWTYVWIPSTPGPVTIRSRAVDDSGNLEGGGTETPSGVPITVTQQNCPCSVQADSGMPTNADENDGTPIELGLRFRSDVSGSIIGIQFYKGITNTGTHVGQLWNSQGNLLGSVTFTRESASGWQQALFATPIPVSANTAYVASYFSPNGGYAYTANYFQQEVYNPPLHALMDGDGGPNGTYRYTSSPAFPSSPANGSGYWVDVLFAPSGAPDTTPPAVTATSPASGAASVSTSAVVSAVFSEVVQPNTVSTATFVLSSPGVANVPAMVTYNAENLTVTLTPIANLAYSTTYTAQIAGGSGGITDLSGNALAATYQWTFTTAPPPAPPPNQGPGGPLLILSSSVNPFSRYYTEILSNEGLNEFTASDISLVTPATLAAYDTIVLGSFPLTAAQVSMLTGWVGNGGNLIAMRPDKQLASLLGLQDAGATLSNSYLLINTSNSPGLGLTNATVQFHGSADEYNLNGASQLATLYANATAATSFPAVTLANYGSGQAAAFSYDLAQSVVYTRQGNPAWSGQLRDGNTLTRSDDLFFGAATFDPEPDWIDFNKVLIPQADEQQRLLANLILQMNVRTKPLPRFWYLPWNLAAAVVMTGDDHGNGGTAGRFNTFLADSPAGCSMANWGCVRGTSYMYPGSITAADADSFNTQGFEIALHVLTNCEDWTPSTLSGFFSSQLATFASTYPSVPAPRTNRTHCVAWSDFDTQPQVELANGIRFDTDYYYWPSTWVQNRPGMFTGSGMPMRFAQADGTTIDVYQATTQMTDESGQTYPLNIDTLLNNAQGALGYYGVFTANMHNDDPNSPGADAIVASAQAHHVPVVSSLQMLTWLDGRNGSSFDNLSWNAGTLSFTIAAGVGANGLEAMLPVSSASGNLTGLAFSGSPVSYTTSLVKGVTYAIFPAVSGSYLATYSTSGSNPTVVSSTPSQGATGVAVSSPVSATFSAPMNAATINSSTFTLTDSNNNPVPAAVAYNAGTQTATLTPTSGLTPATAYTAAISAGATSASGLPLAPGASWSFTTASAAPPPSCPCSLFNDSGTPEIPNASSGAAIELGVQFTSDVAGYVNGIQFLKAPSDTGTHAGHLWDSSGNLIATATFTNETASGWQQALFANPVAIQPNVVYVASYLSPEGYFADTHSFFTQSFNNSPLHAPSGTNGVFSTPGGGSPVFPATTYNASNYWVDVTFTTTLVAIAPSIVTQPVSQSVNAGQSANLSVVAAGSPTLTYQWYMGASGDTSNLIGGATSSTFMSPAITAQASYWVSVTNGAGSVNSAAAVISIAGPSQGDSLPADFAAGTGTCLAASWMTGQGAVSLQPALDAEFTGAGLPASFSSSPWPSGGSVTVSAGAAIVDGAILFSANSYAPGSSLQFVATFSGKVAEHVGFAADNMSDAPWILFSTGQNGGALYARINTGSVSLPDVLLPGNLLNAAHLFRIDWTSSQIVFSVDGAVVSTQSVAITSNLFLIASDYTKGGGSIAVDWFRLSPYASPCTFVSRVFDSGSGAAWSTLSWLAQTPSATSLSLSYRTGNTSTPDSSWTTPVPVPNSGGALSGDSRYIQYLANLASTDVTQTPVLQSVTIAYTITPPPTITIQPAGQSISYGTTASLMVTASGFAPLSYQWYQGNSGDTSLPISNAQTASFTTSSLTVSTSYWVQVSNVAGTVNSATATVTVAPQSLSPTITTQPLSTTVASGATVTLLVTASGTAPFYYQWYAGTSPSTASPINGQTKSTFVTTVTATSSYWVQVTNAAGFANSNTAVITVSTSPYSVLHAFVPGTDLGWGPQSSLIEVAPGVFAGTTAFGASGSGGTEFTMNSSGTVTYVHSFRPGAEGKQAGGFLVEASNGLLYGANPRGGPQGNGVLFDSSGSGRITALQTFSSYPLGTVTPFPLTSASDGNLYGTTAGSSGGMVFRLSLAGGFTKLYTFTASNGVPSGPLMQAIDGNLYGVTSQGLYRMTLAGKFTMLHTFAASEAGTSFGPLVQSSNGQLYGTVKSGGANGLGYVFAATLSGTFTTVYSFASGVGGASPQTGLTQASDKNLYGTTSAGGLNGLGTVFQFNPATNTLMTEYAFVAADGGIPVIQGPGVVQGSDGKLYGAAPGPSTAPSGVVYILNLSLPKPLPKITSLQPSSGAVGSNVSLAGLNLLGATKVSLNGISAAFTQAGSTSIRFVVPSGASTGQVVVVTPNGTATSAKAFTVN